MELAVSPNVENGVKSGGTHRIPSNDGAKSTSIAARVPAIRDVIEPCIASAVQPRVEPAERGPVL
jgi:hypothetical protein